MTDFPWWAVTILIISAFLAIWWLTPTENEKSRKNLEKSVVYEVPRPFLKKLKIFEKKP